jgi:hypothetical protein
MHLFTEFGSMVGRQLAKGQKPFQFLKVRSPHSKRR